MIKIEITVEASIPPMTVVPRICRDAAPDPAAVHRGTQPRMKANAVMRIGRSRRRAPANAASRIGVPFSYSALENSTMRIAFFAARPISITKPICA
jgi:hypothetical protein